MDESSLPDIQRVDIDEATLRTFSSEDEFVGLSVDLLVEADSYVCMAANLFSNPEMAWDREHAVIGGHMVRFYKLLSGLLDQTCQRRRETSFVFARLAFECIVNTLFLIENNAPQLARSYVNHSMRYERRLRKRVRENIERRGGKVLDIERRMLASIERSAEHSGIDLDAPDERDKNWGGKNLFQKAESVGLGDAYLGAFAGPSHSVHGNWQDLLEYHLEPIGSGLYRPEFGWHRPRPQLLTTLATLSADATEAYLDFIGGGGMDSVVEDLDDLRERIHRFVLLHDEFLTRTKAD